MPVNRRPVGETDSHTEAALPQSDVSRAFADQAAEFFADADITQRLNLIRHLLQSTRLAVVVSGDQGIGKTACLHHLRRSAEQRWSLCVVAGASTAEPESVLADLARCCDLPPDCGRPALRQLLREHAAGLNRNSRLPIIAVDDAQALTVPALTELVELMRAEDGWRLLLFAESGFARTLHDNGLLSGTELHALEWLPLSQEQTEAYVQQHLAAVGLPAARPLPGEQLRKLQRESRGLPAAINRLAPLLLTGKPPTAPLPADMRRKPLALRKLLRVLAVVLLLAAVAAILSQQDRINALFEPAAPPQTVTPRAALPARPTAADRATASPPHVATPADHGAGNGAAESSPADANASEPGHAPPADTTLSAPAASADVSAPEQADAAPEQPAAAPDDTPSEEPAATAPGDESAPDSAPPSAGGELPARSESGVELAGDTAQSAPAPTEPAPQPAPAPGSAATETANPQRAAEPSAQAPPPVPPAKPAAERPNRPVSGSGTRWLLARAPDHYTLQLLGSRELGPLQELIARYALHADTAWYQVQYRGAPWYVLVHGDFADSGAAGRAVAALPSGLRRAGPWPRTFAAVQEEVRHGRK